MNMEPMEMRDEQERLRVEYERGYREVFTLTAADLEWLRRMGIEARPEDWLEIFTDAD